MSATKANRQRALIYLRLSQQPGADNDIPKHLSMLKKLVHGLGAEFDEEKDVLMEPEGHRSGRFEKNRPAFQHLLKRIRTEDVRWVAAYDRARIWRDPVEWGGFLRECARLGVGIRLGSEPSPEDIDTFFGMATEMTLGTMNSLYPLYVSKNLKDYNASLRAAGAKLGRAPFGLKIEGKGSQRHVAVSDQTYEFRGITRRRIDGPVEFFRRYATTQFGIHTLTKQLSAEGYCFSFYRGQYRPPHDRTLDYLLHIAKSYHEAGAIPDHIFYLVVKKRDERAHRRMNGRRTDIPNPLRGLLYCAHCGAHLYRTFVRQSTQRYAHPYDPCPMAGKSVLADRLMQELFDWMAAHDNLPQDMKERGAERFARAGDASLENHNRRLSFERAQTKLNRLEETYIAGDLGEGDEARARYRELRAKYKSELDSLAPPVQDELVLAFTPQQGMAIWNNLHIVVAAGARSKEGELTGSLLRMLFKSLCYNFSTNQLTTELSPELRPLFEPE